MSKKRANGEGSISKRKNGTYMARYTVHTPDGPKQKCLYAKTRREVASRLAEVLANQDDGLVFDAKNQTLGDFLDRWLDESVKRNVRPRTLANYRSQVDKHIIPALGRIKLKRASPPPTSRPSITPRLTLALPPPACVTYTLYCTGR
jgi:hypothetical protein